MINDINVLDIFAADETPFAVDLGQNHMLLEPFV